MIRTLPLFGVCPITAHFVATLPGTRQNPSRYLAARSGVPLDSRSRPRLPGNGWCGYHRRSRVETKMHRVEPLGG
ncbi:MAG TPA: hypothetical protein DET67_12640 [Ruegeria sp.]|nr:hypothetical protein [Ruegeria sp.]